MNTDDVSEVSVSLDDTNSAKVEAESSKIDLVVEMSSNEEMNTEFQIADEILTRMELDLACASEKLVNLSVLMLHAATKENEFEATASMTEESLDASLGALEFDLLSRILDSEVIEVENFITSAQEHFFETRKMITSYEHLRNTGMEERLCDSEESLKQSQDRVSEIREQSARFQRTLSYLNRGENWNNNEVNNLSEDNQFSDSESKVKMQTAEQQRRILRMLEKSLAREMDVERKLNESRQVEEDLKKRILFLEQELFYTEEEVKDISERWFAAENAAEVLMETSKELLSKLKLIQFNLTGSIHREAELRSKLDKSTQLGSKENELQNLSSSRKLNEVLLEQTDRLKASLAEAEENLILSNNEALALKENISLLEKQLLNSKLEDTNIESNEQSEAISERVAFVEKQLAESDTMLQHAKASADASQEKENMLYATIRDMETVIEDLKSKALKAENRADSVEDKCIILTESNAELSEELSFLRARLESMEQAEETKISAAKDIDFQTKVIKDLLMQLAIEREHLRKKIAKLALENKKLVLNLKQKHKDPADAGIKKSATGSKKQQLNGQQADKTKNDASSSETDAASADSAEVVRRIDLGVLSFKHVATAMLILLISATAYFISQTTKRSNLVLN